MKPRSAKNKGKRLENRIGQDIADLLGVKFGPRRSVRRAFPGERGTDIVIMPPYREEFPFSVECKNQERWNVPQYIDQARYNKLPDTHWLVVMCKNHAEPVVVMDWQVFLDLYRAPNTK